jgi:hypothetical protein
MTRIFQQHRNISESFIFERENILKSHLIYLLQQDQRCFFYLSRLFFTLDRFGQQADSSLATGPRFVSPQDHDVTEPDTVPPDPVHTTNLGYG